MMAKEKKYVKFRHRVVTFFLKLVFKPLVALKYHNKITTVKDKRPYFILYNHQTAWDQFFVGLTFKKPVYYVASEDIFSIGFVSDIIRYLVSPIPFRKSTTDIRAVKTCIRVAREGASIAISPEGNRTYSGRTGYIRPSIVKLCRALKMPVAILRIEGGYGVQPRWSEDIRGGTMKTYVKRVVEKDEYDALSDDEFLQLLQGELFVDESQPTARYTGETRAEYLERAMYYCPVCGLGKWQSQGNAIRCQKCQTQVLYNEDKSLLAPQEVFPYRNVGEWYDAQEGFIRALDLTAYLDKPVWQEHADVCRVELYKRKHPVAKNASLVLYGDRMEVEGVGVLPFDDCSTFSALGKNKLNVYYKDILYQFKGNKRFNVLVFLNTYYHYQNTKENENGEFLGL